METERDISMEIQDIVEDIVSDVLQMADSMETKEGEESSKSTEWPNNRSQVHTEWAGVVVTAPCNSNLKVIAHCYDLT